MKTKQSQKPSDQAQLKDQLNAVLDSEEAAKSKIASLLHSSALPFLNALKLEIQVDQFRAAKAGSELSQYVKYLEVLSRSYDVLEKIFHEIYPSTLQHVNLFKLLDVYTSDCAKNESVIINFNNPLALKSSCPYSITFQLALYRIYTLILAQLVKVQNCKSLNISISEKKDTLHFDFTAIKKSATKKLKQKSSDPTAHLPLKNIQARLFAISAVVDKKTDWATSAKFRIPIVSV